MELKDRIAEALRLSQKSPTQVAAEAGVSDSAISQLLNGKTKSLKGSTAAGLEKATGVLAQWLINGIGPMTPRDGVIAGALPPNESPEGVRVVMLANEASMGSGADVNAEDVMIGAITLTPKFVNDHVHPSKPDSLRFIHAYGDSMSPTLESGDVLLVDTGVQEVKIDGIYVLRAYNRLFVKRVRQRMDGKFEISSDNPTHKTVDILDGGQDVTVIGRVVWYWNGHRVV